MTLRAIAVIYVRCLTNSGAFFLGDGRIKKKWSRLRNVEQQFFNKMGLMPDGLIETRVRDHSKQMPR